MDNWGIEIFDQRQICLLDGTFDYEIYIRFNVDLCIYDESSARAHFYTKGYMENRIYCRKQLNLKPQQSLWDGFDPEFYLSQHGDVVKVGYTKDNVIYHFNTYGKKERRIFSRSQIITPYNLQLVFEQPRVLLIGDSNTSKYPDIKFIRLKLDNVEVSLEIFPFLKHTFHLHDPTLVHTLRSIGLSCICIGNVNDYNNIPNIISLLNIPYFIMEDVQKYNLDYQLVNYKGIFPTSGLFIESKSFDNLEIILGCSYKQFLNNNWELLIKGIDNELKIMKYIREFGYPLISQPVKYSNKPECVFEIHSYLAKQTLFLRSHQRPHINKNSSKIAVIVEPRKHPLVEAVIRNVMYYLGEEWDLQVFGTADTRNLLTDIFPDWKYTFIELSQNNLNAYTYSQLLKTINFWEQIPGENILIFQTDSFILNLDNLTLWNKYLQYAFVGAPHNIHLNTPKGVGYNGGFSLRRKSAMIECLSKISQNAVDQYRTLYKLRIGFSEDVYFYTASELLGLPLPSMEEAKIFCIQDGNFYPTPIALHGFYHDYLNIHHITTLISHARKF